MMKMMMMMGKLRTNPGNYEESGKKKGFCSAQRPFYFDSRSEEDEGSLCRQFNKFLTLHFLTVSFCVEV